MSPIKTYWEERDYKLVRQLTKLPWRKSETEICTPEFGSPYRLVVYGEEPFFSIGIEILPEKGDPVLIEILEKLGRWGVIDQWRLLVRLLAGLESGVAIAPDGLFSPMSKGN